ncbi:MAG TPA: hypothetical protein VNL91_06335 [Thermoanaerobaculia bacterium]|nr:hypothetical protein [Thermoanaerobaculia bacterium]
MALPLLGRGREVVHVNWFNLSVVGWAVLILALVLAAYKLDVPPVWIGIGALALLGVGIIVSVRHSKPRF